MAISESLIRLEEAITGMEIAIEKAQVVSADLLDNYFGISEDLYICHYHARAGLFSSISLDYVIEMRKLLETAREMVNIEYDTARIQDDKEKSPQSSNK